MLTFIFKKQLITSEVPNDKSSPYVWWKWRETLYATFSVLASRIEVFPFVPSYRITKHWEVVLERYEETKQPSSTMNAYEALSRNSSVKLASPMNDIAKCYLALKYVEDKLQELEKEPVGECLHKIKDRYTADCCWQDVDTIFSNLGYWSKDNDAQSILTYEVPNDKSSPDVWYRDYKKLFAEFFMETSRVRDLQETISWAKSYFEECMEYNRPSSIMDAAKAQIQNSRFELASTMHNIAICYFALKYVERKLQEHVSFGYTSRASEYEDIFRNLDYWSIISATGVRWCKDWSKDDDE